MPHNNNKAVALVTVLIILIVVVVLAVALIGVMASQARIAEHQVRRVKAFYTAEAGIRHAMDDLMNGTNPGTWTSPTPVNEYNLTFNASYNNTTGTLNSTVNYTIILP